MLALAVACAYAAFASGATDPPRDTWLQVGLAGLALGAVASWAQGGAVRWRAGRAAAAGLALLAGLAAWETATLAWSLTPDGTWMQANRALAYALVVALALAAGASDPRSAERAVTLVLASCTLVALYAFATKVLPGFRVPGLIDFAAAGRVNRLGEPLDAPNALAVVCATGVPLAVRLACEQARRRRERCLAVASGLLLVCVVGLTYSRGGLLALAAAVAVLIALGPGRLRGLAAVAEIVAAAVGVLAVAFTLDGTAENGVALARRSADGRILLGVFALGVAVLLAAALLLWRLEPRVRWSAARSRRVVRGLVAVVILGLLLAAVGFARSERGLSGAISDRASAFTASQPDDRLDPKHLLSTSSDHRWAWWGEAAGAWSARPAVGWGAGSFGALHLRYREDRTLVRQAHSVPLQLMAETGVVGLALFVGAIGLLATAALARVRSLLPGRERDMAAAALAGVVAWLVHAAYEPDWNIPGATLPALVLLGVVAGAGGRERVARRRASATAAAVVPAALVAILVALSAILPAWADGKASRALASLAAEDTDTDLRNAAAAAGVAARLDPLATRPLLVSAAIARRRGRLLEARDHALQAVARQPQSSQAWLALAGSALDLADRAGFELAASKALELDPMGARARDLASAAVANRTPAGASATAVGTPLTPAPVLESPPPVVPPAGATGPAGATDTPGAATGAPASGATGVTGAGAD